MRRTSKTDPAKSEVALRATRKLIDSRRLLYFYHVAKAGRFTAAEAVLDVAQSAMSRQIQQLEAELEVQLLDRTGHGVSLTPHGEILFRHAETILNSMASTIDEIAEARHQPLGTVTIAAPPSYMATHMAAVILAFRRQRPGVRLCAVEASTGGVYDHLASGEVDLAIVLQPTNTARLVLRELTREPLYLIAAADHPVARQDRISRAALRDLDLLLPASLHGSRAVLSEYFAEAGMPLRSQLEADSLPLMRALVRTGQFCTILPRATCEAELSDGTFKALSLRPALHRTLFIAHLRDRPLTDDRRLLAELVLAQARGRHGSARDR